MSPAQVLLLAFLIGVVAGLRTMMAPTVVAWAAYRNRLQLHDTPFSFLGSTAAVVVLTLMALGELVVDKLPSTPSRTTVAGLGGRMVFGGLAGAALVAGSQSAAVGALLGVVGAIVGAFAGAWARRSLVRALNVPDYVIACVEDVVAIAGGLFVVSRF